MTTDMYNTYAVGMGRRVFHDPPTRSNLRAKGAGATQIPGHDVHFHQNFGETDINKLRRSNTGGSAKDLRDRQPQTYADTLARATAHGGALNFQD